MFEKAFKNIDTILKNDGGSSTELDYTEQTSWILFLKYLDALEQDKSLAADLAPKKVALKGLLNNMNLINYQSIPPSFNI
jgi:hypothetical protein